MGRGRPTRPEIEMSQETTDESANDRTGESPVGGWGRGGQPRATGGGGRPRWGGPAPGVAPAPAPAGHRESLEAVSRHHSLKKKSI